MALFNRRDLTQKMAMGGFVKAIEDYVPLLESQNKTKQYDIFLSHSYLNAKEVFELKKVIEGFGLSVYVDWIEDKKLSRANVTKATAKILRERMKNCRCLVYAYTLQSTVSKWMPWELGFFDGYRGRVAILPIEEKSTGTNTFKGQEYLGLYPYITKETDVSNTLRMWVNDGDPSHYYVLFHSWLAGEDPTYHA